MKATSAALAAATASGIPCQKLDFVYDSQGRRVSKTIFSSTNGTAWTFSSNQRFLYDDWNLIAEYSTTQPSPNDLTLQATHTWGVDLSGTQQGAGGVGGLLATHLVAAPAAACYPAYDGNGNINAWIDGAGALLGRMDYSPFGQLIAQYKFTSTANLTLSRLPFGFSTKYTDVGTGLLYYGYRYYDAVTGRWTSRDPIEEQGGLNAYGFNSNNVVAITDYLGLKPGDTFKTWELARSDSERYLTKERYASLDRGWKEFKSITGVDSKNMFAEPNSWIGKMKEYTGEDSMSIQTEIIAQKPSFAAIIGREVASSVYCLDLNDSSGPENQLYSYNYYSGSMVTKDDYTNRGLIGTVTTDKVEMLLDQKMHGKYRITHHKYFIHTHILHEIKIPTYADAVPVVIPHGPGLSPGDIGSSIKYKIVGIAIEKDGRAYWIDGRNGGGSRGNYKIN